MPARRKPLLALALTAAALALPGAASGQSAGDEQYSDPFGGEDQQQESSQQGSSQPEQTAQTTDDLPAELDPTDAPAGTSAERLPATGLPALALLAVGGGMLAGGFLLRLRT